MSDDPSFRQIAHAGMLAGFMVHIGYGQATEIVSVATVETLRKFYETLKELLESEANE